MWDWLTWSAVGHGLMYLFGLACVVTFAVGMFKTAWRSDADWEKMTPEQRREFLKPWPPAI